MRDDGRFRCVGVDDAGCQIFRGTASLGARGVPVADGCPRLHQSFSYVILSADSKFRRWTVGRLLVFLLLTI